MGFINLWSKLPQSAGSVASLEHYCAYLQGVVFCFGHLKSQKGAVCVWSNCQSPPFDSTLIYCLCALQRHVADTSLLPEFAPTLDLWCYIFASGTPPPSILWPCLTGMDKPSLSLDVLKCVPHTLRADPTAGLEKQFSFGPELKLGTSHELTTTNSVVRNKAFEDEWCLLTAAAPESNTWFVAEKEHVFWVRFMWSAKVNLTPLCRSKVNWTEGLQRETGVRSADHRLGGLLHARFNLQM